ncbi:MAG: hypothetical protein F6K50_16045 [Moorea sp. SIO3I7]|nr:MULTISPECIES: hypothetical protein [unclassified Moorena]NEN96986.1 hypothetical protein [Moorena sp. SIO3I7]NEO05828.1 hypothetical protein [Moorena sp. SIO3I8]NEO20222.1 hypothetical protein [Moorena sp. SIO4A5]NEP22670.1 hypothetical protein [Moorena sp. SIO3I6]
MRFPHLIIKFATGRTCGIGILPWNGHLARYSATRKSEVRSQKSEVSYD